MLNASERERDKYLGSADHVWFFVIFHIITHRLLLPLLSIQSEFEEVHGTLKPMTLFVMLPSTIDDDADEPPISSFMT